MEPVPLALPCRRPAAGWIELCGGRFFRDGVGGVAAGDLAKADRLRVTARLPGDLACAVPIRVHLSAGNGYGAWVNYLRSHTLYAAGSPWTAGSAFAQ